MNTKAWSKRAMTVAVLATLVALPALKGVGAQDTEDAPGWGYGYGMGPGMMGGGYGMGPGMMWGGGYGGYGMGPGMMGYWAYGQLNLSDTQRENINKILDQERRGHWAIMGRMMDQQEKMRDLYEHEQPDPKAVGAVYAAIAKLRQQMIETHVAAQNRIDQLLTKEQREELQQMPRGGWGPRGGYGYGPGMMGPGYMGDTPAPKE